MCGLTALSTTDRLLLGQHVAVTAPTLQVAREYVTRTAQQLRTTGHHVYHSIGKVTLDNGGTLEALSSVGLHEWNFDHAVLLGHVDLNDILPDLATTGGTNSRR